MSVFPFSKFSNRFLSLLRTKNVFKQEPTIDPGRIDFDKQYKKVSIPFRHTILLCLGRFHILHRLKYNIIEVDSLLFTQLPNWKDRTEDFLLLSRKCCPDLLIFPNCLQPQTQVTLNCKSSEKSREIRIMDDILFCEHMTKT